MAIAAAGSSGDVDEALLARVAQILSENEASSGGAGGSASGLVDGELLSRVSQILAQNEGSSGGSSSGYSAPAPSQSYGAPSRSAGGSSGSLQIGRPERAQRVAEFDLSSQNTRSSSSSGGYN